MSEFEREERYIVIKRKHLSEEEEFHLRRIIAETSTPLIECVVVEADWPNYEHVWKTIEAVANGTWEDDYLRYIDGE